MFTLAGQAAVGNEREEFISTRKHLVSFDSLHRNSGGNSNKQTGQAGRGENVKQRRNIIAAGEICSLLLAKSLIVFFPFFSATFVSAAVPPLLTDSPLVV